MAIYKNFKTIPQLFQIMCKDFGKGKVRPAITHRQNENWIDIKYDELYKQTEEFALGLAALGVKRGNKIAIIAENRPEWVYSDMAILGLGAVDIPLYPSLTAESVQFILNNSESKGIIISNKFQLNKVLKIKS